MQDKQKVSPVIGWIALAISTTFFTGFLGKNGKGGGTAGALVALAAQMIMLYLNVSAVWVVTVAIATFFIGLVAVGPGERFMLEKLGPRPRHNGQLTDHDFNETNWDEVHGQFVAGLPVWFIPWLPSFWIKLIPLFTLFVLFRYFDAKKIGPVKWFEERWDGTAFGVMIDDTIAGLIPAVALLAMFYIGRIFQA